MAKALAQPYRVRRCERSGFGLRRFRRVAENLRAGGVVKFYRLRLVAGNLEQPQGRHADFFASRFRDFETQTDMALTGEMINLRGPHFGKNPPQRRAIGKIAVMQKKTMVVNIFVAPQMFDARAQKVARSPNDSMNGVAFSRSNSARYEPSCPVIPVTKAVFGFRVIASDQSQKVAPRTRRKRTRSRHPRPFLLPSRA